MRELAEVDDENMGVDVDWLRNTPTEYERLVHNVNEDLIQPTNNLSDLMYKSVGIRDSRQSLQLSLSMWRLSWITFIFLPLSFITSVFGMNVDIFENFPSVGWYFLTASVLMIFGEDGSSPRRRRQVVLTLCSRSTHPLVCRQALSTTRSSNTLSTWPVRNSVHPPRRDLPPAMDQHRSCRRHRTPIARRSRQVAPAQALVRAGQDDQQEALQLAGA
jgi:hypothetical protein